MAERLHWPAERVAALRQERDALDVASSDLLLSDERCEPLRSFIDRAIQRAPLGEVASIRAAIAASGKSLEELAELAGVRRQESMKAANTASAASGS
jgi:hypothetical protein